MEIKELCLLSLVLVCNKSFLLAVDIVEDYNVTLFNSGPVFYGSNLTFTAQLYSGTSQVPKDAKFFKYEWSSDATHLTETQDADFKTSLTRCYSAADPDTYQMSLRVYNAKILRTLVAKATQTFTLTDTLNGKMIGSQKGGSGNQGFSTQKPVMVKLDIHDKFKENPEYRYEWFLEGSNTTTISTTFPSHQFDINTPGMHTVKVKVHSDRTVDGCGGFEDLKPKGEFQTNLQMYVPIGGVQIVGKNSLKNNTFVMEEVYFNGSSPFNISWCFMNVTAHAHDIACDKFVNMNRSSPVNVRLNRTLHTGHYSFVVNVSNAVSKQGKHHNFTVSERESPTHSAAVIVLPVLGGLALVTLVLAAVYVVIPRWKGKHVETADFDFHPTLRLPSNTEEEHSTGFFSALYNRLFCKTDRRGSTGNQNMHRVGMYGSIESSVTT